MNVRKPAQTELVNYGTIIRKKRSLRFRIRIEGD